jgi:hypothetical protein
MVNQHLWPVGAMLTRKGETMVTFYRHRSPAQR